MNKYDARDMMIGMEIELEDTMHSLEYELSCAKDDLNCLREAFSDAFGNC
jgi:hypothetical protein